MPRPAPGSDGVLETIRIRARGDDGLAFNGEHAGGADSGQAIHADARTRVDVEYLALAACGAQAGRGVIIEEAVKTSTYGPTHTWISTYSEGYTTQGVNLPKTRMSCECSMLTAHAEVWTCQWVGSWKRRLRLNG